MFMHVLHADRSMDSVVRLIDKPAATYCLAKK
jgi:hypothetical protein